jgi:hypothetical protein
VPQRPQERLLDHVRRGLPVAHQPVRVGDRLPMFFIDSAEQRLIGRIVAPSPTRGTNRAIRPSTRVTFLRPGCVGRPRFILGLPRPYDA